MDVLEKLKEAVTNLDTVESEVYNFISRLSEVEAVQQDLLHYLENEKLTTNGFSRIGRKLKEIRMERRKIKVAWEIYNTYGPLRNRLSTYEQRQFLIQELHKKAKSLDTIYNYRVYTKEFLDEIANGKKKEVNE